MLLFCHVSIRTMTLKFCISLWLSVSCSRSILLFFAHTLDKKSDGIAGLVALARSLASSPALFPLFCLWEQRFLLAPSHLWLLLLSVDLKIFSLPSIALGSGGSWTWRPLFSSITSAELYFVAFLVVRTLKPNYCTLSVYITSKMHCRSRRTF